MCPNNISGNISNHKHRLGTREITLVGKDGSLIRNGEVHVRQTNHRFLFGCSEFSSLAYRNNEFEGEVKQKAEERFEKFFDLFNYATLLFIGEILSGKKADRTRKG